MKNSGARRTTKPADVDEYLAAVPKKQRAALERLRRAIRSVVPEATEVISYRIPIFKYKGRMLVGFRAAKNHCSFYLLSSDMLPHHAAELKGYDLSTGTIRFSSDKPLPVALVKKLLKLRMAENEKATKKKRNLQPIEAARK